ncbi:MAG: hypothetical protein EOP61_02195 [Sphingomonadales bacterium]|nr:MAG: hypothetical protein EOP61_02195 [Sphingomonadales bacterium]
MARAEQIEIRLRIVIAQPVPGVAHSLQSGDDRVLDPKISAAGEALAFDFPVRVGPGPKFFGDQVRREGPQRRFVYIRIGTMAGDHLSPWSRRMKIDIHDIPPQLLDRAMAGGVVELVVNGTGRDGTPACATVPTITRRIA